VQDLLALGRFVVLPEDDLSLAALLKSPLFNLSEDDVFDVAATRSDTESVWQRLQTLSKDENSRFFAVANKLKNFIALSKTATVHDFFAAVLTLHDGRKKFLGRLGNEASDVLDEFLSFALDHERTGLPGLQAFLSVLETDSPEVKREQDKDRGEVRIMTVHASKGLEAPVVFVVDGGSKAFNHSHVPKLRFVEADGDAFPVWLPGSGFSNHLIRADEERLKTAAEDEYRRLLYVAMTRAADHLVVCGYRGQKENPECWHAIVKAALADNEKHCQPQQFMADGEEWQGLVWRKSDIRSTPAPQRLPEPQTQEEYALPAGLLTPLPALPSLPRPLSPSGAGTIIDDGADDLAVRSPLFGEKADVSSLALQRGRLVHRMLQALPDFAESEREEAARRYAERAARFWPSAEREHLIRAVLRVMSEPSVQPAFSPNSRAEVSIMGTMTIGRQHYAVSGRIDRLAVDGDRVILVDYKTNRVPPRDAHEIPFSHTAQLAIYREILSPLYPGKEFVCALIYTENAAFMTVGDDAMMQALAAIKTK